MIAVRLNETFRDQERSENCASAPTLIAVLALLGGSILLWGLSQRAFSIAAHRMPGSGFECSVCRWGQTRMRTLRDCQSFPVVASLQTVFEAVSSSAFSCSGPKQLATQAGLVAFIFKTLTSAQDL